MIDIAIQPLTAANQGDLNCSDNSFTVEVELRLTAEDGRVDYSVEPVTPYVKHYDPEIYDAQAYLEKPDHAAWLAYVDGQLAGQILVHENPGLSEVEGWNRFAIIIGHRRGPAFPPPGCRPRADREASFRIEQAVAWARARELPGVMLETQNINIPACRLYASCGFVLSGFDAYLYRSVMPGTREIALFWYLLF